MYMNGYVVNISYEEAEKLHGKTVEVSGKVTVRKGLNNLPKEYEENGDEIIGQGRMEDTRYIESPVIKILED